VLEFGFGDDNTFSESFAIAGLRAQAAQVVLGYIVAPSGDPAPAQRAVELALSQRAGVPQLPKTAAPTADVTEAAARFAALPAPQSRAWLVANLDRLQHGQVTLQELP
jgi:hypothetical protein